MPKLSRAEITGQIAALEAELAASDGGFYEDLKTGRWFIVMRPPGRAKTTTRRRAPDGMRLTTREQALIAKGQWEAQLARGDVAVGRERFESAEVAMRPSNPRLQQMRHLGVGAWRATCAVLVLMLAAPAGAEGHRGLAGALAAVGAEDCGAAISRT